MQGSPVHYEFEDLSPVEKRLKVEVAKEHVSSMLEQAYKKLSREVTLRGFRPGKAPRAMLEKMFGKRVEYDVTQDLLRDTLTFVAQQTQVRMVGQPVLEAMPEIKKNETMKYSARIELFPQLELQGWEGIEVSRRAAKASDEAVNEVLERKRQEHVDMVPIDQAARPNASETDNLVIAITGEIGQNKWEGEEIQLDLGGPRSPIPGLGKALVGIPLSATDHEVKFNLPTEGIREELAGKEVVLKVAVKQAYEKKLPALDDDFAKDTGEAETFEELRNKVRDQLLKDDADEAKDEARMAILEEVAKRNPVPLPPSLIKRFTDQFYDMQKQRAYIAAFQEGKDPRKEGVIDDAKLKEDAHGEAIKALSKEFLLMTIAEKEQIDVTQADVEKRLSELSRQQDKSVGRVRAEMQKDDPQLEGLKQNLRLEKALDLLESRAKIVEAGS
jgi:trigger factor